MNGTCCERDILHFNSKRKLICINSTENNLIEQLIFTYIHNKISSDFN